MQTDKIDENYLILNAASHDIMSKSSVTWWLEYLFNFSPLGLKIAK